jgi:hypothetical protein
LNQLKEFRYSHQRNDSGLLTKYMKIWLNKSTFSTKAENLVSFIRYIENNTWVRGNTRFISSVEHDISRVSAANE